LALVPYGGPEQWLADALESLVAQSRPPDAIAVLDDRSAAPPTDIVRRYAHVTLLAAPAPVESGPLVRQAIRETSYDAYLLQRARDWSSPERLEALLVEAARSEAELLGSYCVQVDPGRGTFEPVPFPVDVNRAIREDGSSTALLHASCLVGRDLMTQLDAKAARATAGDMGFLARACQTTRVVNVARYLYFFRVGDDSNPTGTQAVTGAIDPKVANSDLDLDSSGESTGTGTPARPAVAPSKGRALVHLAGPELRFE
jgi:hypothetical protein